MKQTLRLSLLFLMAVLAGCSRSSVPDVHAVAQDLEGRRWAGTHDGLYREGDDGVFRALPVPSLSHHPFPGIYALTCDTLRGRMWIGAWNHLYCYDLKRERFVTTADSTIYATVGLMSDTAGVVLAWTEHGLYRFTLDDSLPGGLAERLDSTCYPKPAALVNTSGWQFEQSAGQDGGGVLLGVMGLVAVGGLLLLFWLMTKRRRVVSPAPADDQEVSQPPTDDAEQPDLRRLFMQRAERVVDAHIDDENFNADVFAREMAVSRAQLFRKLKAACGQTVMDYINQRRMTKASHLLLTTDRTLADIALSVGVSDASNFRRVFIRYYGLSPREYREQQRPADDCEPK